MSVREDRDTKRPKKDIILELSKYIDKQIRIKFTGGREVKGFLKGFDGLMNLVLDGAQEALPDAQRNYDITNTRDLGLIIVRGPQIVVISPMEGTEEIDNPFLQAE